MSKGNMLLGYARGKVGDVVMARALGKQQTRAYNDKPKNPKTESQMNQRVKMLNLINFYKFSKNYLQYEKGGSNTKYSTFNKFVRYNIAKTPIYLTKEQFLNNVAVPNNYFYSIGSLAWSMQENVQIEYLHDQTTNKSSVFIRFALPDNWVFSGTTIKEKVLKAMEWAGAKSPSAILTGYWCFYSVTKATCVDSYSISLNPNDIDPAATGNSWTTPNGIFTIRIDDGENKMISITKEVSTEVSSDTIISTAKCWSLVDNGRLKVSTSEINLNNSMDAILQNYQSESARIAAINSYKVGEPIELRTGSPID